MIDHDTHRLILKHRTAHVADIEAFIGNRPSTIPNGGLGDAFRKQDWLDGLCNDEEATPGELMYRFLKGPPPPPEDAKERLNYVLGATVKRRRAKP